MPKDDLKAQREALKADILRMKGGKKSTATAQSEASEESSEEDALANTNQSHFTVNLNDDRVATLAQFGYPIDYVKYTILENEANYAVTAYYLLGTDQNY